MRSHYYAFDVLDHKNPEKFLKELSKSYLILLNS